MLKRCQNNVLTLGVGLHRDWPLKLIYNPHIPFWASIIDSIPLYLNFSCPSNLSGAPWFSCREAHNILLAYSQLKVFSLHCVGMNDDVSWNDSAKCSIHSSVNDLLLQQKWLKCHLHGAFVLNLTLDLTLTPSWMLCSHCGFISIMSTYPQV